MVVATNTWGSERTILRKFCVFKNVFQPVEFIKINSSQLCSWVLFTVYTEEYKQPFLSKFKLAITETFFKQNWADSLSHHKSRCSTPK